MKIQKTGSSKHRYGHMLGAVAFVGLLSAASFFAVMVQPAQAVADELLDALSDRHSTPAFSQLEKLAGGREQLITRLLEIRTDQETPLVGLRAAHLLLANFQGEENIAQAFEEDLTRQDRLGIARSLAIHVDEVPSSSARLRLAQGILKKAAADPSFAKSASSLSGSKDEAVRRLARQQFGAGQ